LSLSIIGVIGVVVLVLIFLSGMPVAFAMALIGFAGACYLSSVGAGFNLLAREFWQTFSTYTLSVIPMFVLMGAIAFNSGISTRLYATAYSFLGHLRGGLALATTAGCALFAAVCGSTAASAAAMGKVTLPEMKRYNYEPSLATGSVAAGGTLGILIPPSTGFIFYSILTGESVGRLFMAGILPGINLTILFMIAVYIICRFNPNLGPAGSRTPWKSRVASLSGSIDMILLFVLVMGGLFAGIFTPTEAGAAGAGGALILSLARRQMSWRRFADSLLETVAISSMVFVILAGAFVFGRFVAYTRIPFELIDWLSVSPLSAYQAMWLIILLYMVGGCFMDFMPLGALTIPILYPVILHLGFDGIWFGVICVLTAEMGVITPPVGMNVYVIKGVAPEVPIQTIFKGVVPFVLAIMVCIALQMHFSQIALFLPNLMMG
jgi:C4-dicarboxylate transporter DctM subunit